MPQECIIYKHPLFDRFLQEDVLSKQCKDTFAGYAFSQIKKAKGLNKKINNPVAPARKTPLDFCYIAVDQGSLPLARWLQLSQIRQEDCGLVIIPNMRDLFHVFYDTTGDLGFNGIVKKENSNDICLSSIPKGQKPIAVMSFHKDAYIQHCKDHREYWDWVSDRNETRYQNTLEHGKNYDSKNMMHTFRLLDMAIEILQSGQVLVKRPNRQELLAIRRGEFSYEELMERAERKLEWIERAYEGSDLAERPNVGRIEEVLVEVRENFNNKKLLK